MGDTPTSDLLRPFYDDWSRGHQSAAQALWDWHSALVNPTVPGETSVDSFFDEERARAEAGEPLRAIPEDTATAAYKACESHALNVDWLAAQVEAARLLVGTTRFDDANQLDTFVRLWAAPHARLLAHLADVTNSVQMGWVDELARGFFHLAHLLRLPTDLAHGRLFVPVAELRQYDVSTDQLRTGPATEGARRLLWKQSVRVRDALQRGRALANDLGFRHRYALLRYWHGALALLDELDRRDYDLWSAPIELSPLRRLEVYLLMLFGRR
ncbi:MAG: squalene/phytoene synthase family protein [Salinibacter sp.]|uniref:squalene/phytoene synthase family protein n=1 Tax=Salinibacter sp. TaxID=2065818 RepID=UPI002FC2C248